MAARVLVVERDEALREVTMEVLGEEGYAVAGVGEVDLARAAVRVSAYPLVVLVGHGDPRDAAPSLVEDAGHLPLAAYVMLSTRPQTAPHALNPHTRRAVPVVAEPFALDGLVEQVDEARRILAMRMAERAHNNKEEQDVQPHGVRAEMRGGVLAAAAR